MRNPEIAGSNLRTRVPPPALPATLIMRRVGRRPYLHLPQLDINGYYNFISTTMIVLFIIGLVIIFVYEYEALRRSKT
jgi:hypothetical protein